MKVTVTWKNGFVMSYNFDYATKKRVADLQKHYDSLSWVESVKMEKL